MRTTFIKLSLVALFAFFYPLKMAEAESESPVVRGTINVILADSDGIVAVTDSMQSTLRDGHYVQLPSPGKKLFQLDERTICTVAGFLGAPTEQIPEFLNNTAAIIEEYRQQTSRSGVPIGFHDKVGALASVFRFFLGGIANIRSDFSNADQYRFEMFIVGYDLDDLPHVGSIVIGLRGRGDNDVEPVFEETSDVPLSANFTFFVHGVRPVAEKILTGPSEASLEPEIRNYAKLKATGQTGSLNVGEMQTLAVALSKETAKQFSVVGGPDQIAILSHGKVVSIKQPNFPKTELPPFNFNLIIGQKAFGEMIRLPLAGAVNVYVHNHFSDCPQVILESNFFVGNKFESCPFVYDGFGKWTTRFGTDNTVANSVLIVGPNAKNAKQVNELINNFRWNTICRAASPRTKQISCTNGSGATVVREWRWPWPESP